VPSEANVEIEKLLRLMARLRDPECGCPWDKQQTFRTIAPYTIEEAYEVADAIESGDMRGLALELGDLLFQVVFHAQMGREAGLFCFEDVVGAICDKMERRHPHVFGDTVVGSAEEQSLAWEAHKERERSEANAPSSKRASVLDGVPRGLPSIVLAMKIQKRAARVGFDWSDVRGVVEKLREELAEFEAELGRGSTRDLQEDELGDVLFSCINLARHLKIDPELALRGATRKFERRFRALEAELTRSGRTLLETTAEEMDQCWERIKAKEATSSS